MKLYVLELEDDCWYVGISKDPDKRVHDHGTIKGAKWTFKHKPLQPVEDHIQIFDLGRYRTLAECELEEDMVTEGLQKKFGLNKVRGGYTIFCKDMKKRPTRRQAKWLYEKCKKGFY